MGEILLAIRHRTRTGGADRRRSLEIQALRLRRLGHVRRAGRCALCPLPGVINPEIFGVAQSLDAILAVILGGSGTIAGPVIGAFLVVFLPELLRFADSFRLILYGLILVLATIFMPIGIVGIGKALIARISRTGPRHAG